MVVARGARTVAVEVVVGADEIFSIFSIFWFRFISKSEGSFLFLSIDSEALVEAEEVVGIFKVPFTDVAMAGIVPVPVAAIMDGSACCRSHCIVSPSDLCPSSLVS
ncbi:hypothetical protein HanIR_Chr04g0198391 [Helianthus annuus]|nr:hypothetical protein HanIR_Chr04g0198391 [Helianthus annuus]